MGARDKRRGWRRENITFRALPPSTHKHTTRARVYTAQRATHMPDSCYPTDAARDSAIPRFPRRLRTLPLALPFRSRSYVLLLRAPLRLGGSGWCFSDSSWSRRFEAFSVLWIAGVARANATISTIYINWISTADQLNRQKRKLLRQHRMFMINIYYYSFLENVI